VTKGMKLMLKLSEE
jgi:hypothetical protein